MKLDDLFSIFPELPLKAFPETEVSGVFNDARQVVPNSVYVAIRGHHVDGHRFIPDAVTQGALVLVIEDLSTVPADFAGLVLQTANSREALDVLASRFYGDPGAGLFCVGVTGTNGKTSVSYMIESILNAAQIPTGVIGTINHHLGDKVWPSNMTTPDPVFLQKRLREFKDSGAQAVALEVSSHALDQRRVDSVPFNTVIFTNLTRDHLDYHQSMKKYLEAKQRLFTDLLWSTTKQPCFAIVNTADKYGRRLRIADPAVLWTYGSREADLRYKIRSMDFALTEFEVQTPAGRGLLTLPMAGVHNVLNSLAAIGAALSAGIPLPACLQALNLFTGVPGRLQSVPNPKGVSVFVDYAHSPDALENVLISIQRVRRSLNSKARIWTVFGCGGDRDHGKRPLMAQVADKYSDQVIITSDNPRTESPEDIIKDILVGVADFRKVRTYPDRREAITEALSEAQPGDVVLIAGKGHEDYQIIGTEKFPFSDVLIAQEVLGVRS